MNSFIIGFINYLNATSFFNQTKLFSSKRSKIVKIDLFLLICIFTCLNECCCLRDCWRCKNTSSKFIQNILEHDYVVLLNIVDSLNYYKNAKIINYFQANKEEFFQQISFYNGKVFLDDILAIGYIWSKHFAAIREEYAVISWSDFWILWENFVIKLVYSPTKWTIIWQN